MRRKTAVLALVASFAVLASVSPASANDARLVGYMFGSNERPALGDPDGVGRAYVTINDAANQLCVTIQFTNISLPATGFHIHLGSPGSAGPVVVPFAAPTANQSVQCVTVENEALLDDIAANPANYYINVHNAEFPGGAARGQLQPI
jgi:hypothetical protein